MNALNLFNSSLEEHFHRAASAATVLRMAIEAIGDAPTRDELNALLTHAYSLEDSAMKAQAAFLALVTAAQEASADNVRETQDFI